MVKFGVGQPMTRVEDDRLITGQGRYADDVRMDGQAYAVLVRSPYAHAKLGEIDVSDAKTAQGVLGVYTIADFDAAGFGEVTNAAWAMVKNRDGTPMYKTTRPILARDRVRYAGEPVAVVVATSELLARDAAELVMVDYDELPVVVDTARAAESDAPVLFEEHGSNVVYDWELGDEDAIQEAKSKAAHVTKVSLINNRIVVNAMEPRAALGVYEAASEKYTLYTGSQGVHGMRARLADGCLNVPVEKLRVVSDDVGGGFGMKTFVYNEYPIVLFAAKALGRPVKWTGDRSESFLSDTQGRDHVTEAELMLDKEGLILGVDVRTIANLGAYQSQFAAFIPTLAPRGMHTGVYKVPALYNRVKAVMTNTVPVDAYRGAGRPEASYVIERLMDAAARETGLGAAEIRRRNFIPASEMPYNVRPSLPFDSGDFDRNLTDALAKSDYDGFEARRKDAASRGKYAGIGISYYVERTAAGMTEFARLEVDAEHDLVHVYTGQQSNGQGHETVWTQYVASRLGVDVEKIKVHAGDSEVLAGGAGTGGSKAVYMATGALGVASDNLIEKGRAIAANELEAAVIDVEFRGSDGDPSFGIVGTDRRIGLFDVARIAATQVDIEDFSADGEYDQKGNTFPNGAHVCEIEIDGDTGAFAITRYTVVDDFGMILNPLIVAGQVHGGIVQGLGQAMGEHAVYDEDSGQLLTGSFQDYWMPRADDMPFFDVNYNEIPARSNELGVKGAGEAGTVGAPAAFIAAVIDALQPFGVKRVDMPVTPQKLWRLMASAHVDAA
ncbi:MAG: xanthine dehydrogenase family protein molybdopterin-binding subunit [Alphaproteobacteria bacterium]|nr:xanthine dehydrogenase family protein molybdopterin-binding subunit [Alphaproteobacteria bacterium]MBO6628247.1 xanthine dehydrogenase family protein molybdopterin-binding subunit [Alphaproteobacteria bacterium]MDF1627272.1 xanthine dehydrogenase family protein molybdopterin-binding subunit [Parvibaculaceae bacterium]